MSAPAESRLDRWLFAPAAPGAVTALRALLAGTAACVFWPEPREPLPVFAAFPGLAALQGELALSPFYAAAAIGLLLPWAFGLRPRVLGALAFLALLPLVPVEGVARSRQVLLFAIVACTLLPARGAAGPIWPVRLVQLQLSVLYGVNALAKMTPAYLSGDVLAGFAEMLPHFHATVSDGRFVVGPLALPLPLAALASVLVEACLALGFWHPRTRIPTALLGVAFHAGLTRVVTIGWLDWVSVALYAAFLLPFTRRREAAVPSGDR